MSLRAVRIIRLSLWFFLTIVIACHGLTSVASEPTATHSTDASETSTATDAATWQQMLLFTCGELRQRGIKSTRHADRAGPLTPTAIESTTGAAGQTRISDFIVPHNHLAKSTTPSVTNQQAVNQKHAKIFSGNRYPSAAQCKTCHPGHYREWSVSSHAYAQLSPVFNAMSGKLLELTNGTLGDFCIRCHTPVGMALNEPIVMSNMDRHPASREGVTCVVCHRINQNWGKGSGRQSIIAGDIHSPVVGPNGNDILSEVLNQPQTFGTLKTQPDPEVKGRPVHRKVIPFFQLTTSATCAACHDVFAPNGFRLEDAFSEYKTSPAARVRGQSCQDCHMGQTPGEAKGYIKAPAAKVGNVWTTARKRTNHMIMGPDYSIVHPGIFPHNPDAVREEHDPFKQEIELGLATMREWLTFDHQAGWGTPDFETKAAKGDSFPPAWQSQARRFRARDILDQQFKLIAEAGFARQKVLTAGYKLSEIIVDDSASPEIGFSVKVFNGTEGHGVPTGFDAERLLYLRVTMLDRDGKLLFVSGDLDPNGDLRDHHSLYVHNGKLPLDGQLFTLQSRFLTRNVRGGEREQVLAVPFSLDPLPYIRPETRPFTVLGRPIGARKHKQNIEVGGHRWATYRVPSGQLNGLGPYTVFVQMISGMVPVNLIHSISSVGFDYGLSAKEVAKRVVAGHSVLQTRSIVVHSDYKKSASK